MRLTNNFKMSHKKNEDKSFEKNKDQKLATRYSQRIKESKKESFLESKPKPKPKSFLFDDSDDSLWDFTEEKERKAALKKIRSKSFWVENEKDGKINTNNDANEDSDDSLWDFTADKERKAKLRAKEQPKKKKK